MAGEWREHSLGELCSLITDGKHGDCRNEAGSGYYFLSVKDVFGDRMVYDNARQILESDFAETHRRTNLEPGDILFTNTGTIGRMAIAPDDPRTARTTFQKSVAILKPKREIVLSRFLYFALRFDNARLSDFAAGTTQKNLLLKDLRAFKIRIPLLAEQKAIAAVLGALDDKIELNRRMNATLEAMARALFQSWFVDFDPVRAKLDGRQPANLDPATATLFPNSFEDSPIGLVPKDWEVREFGEVIELAYGKPLKAEDRKRGLVCVYGANGPVGWHDEKLVSGPGIVVGRKGNPGVVTWAHGDFYPIDTTFYVEPKGGCRSLYFLYYALSLHNLANLSADSAVPGLTRLHE